MNIIRVDGEIYNVKQSDAANKKARWYDEERGCTDGPSLSLPLGQQSAKLYKSHGNLIHFNITIPIF